MIAIGTSPEIMLALAAELRIYEFMFSKAPLLLLSTITVAVLTADVSYDIYTYNTS